MSPWGSSDPPCRSRPWGREGWESKRLGRGAGRDATRRAERARGVSRSGARRARSRALTHQTTTTRVSRDDVEVFAPPRGPRRRASVVSVAPAAARAARSDRRRGARRAGRDASRGSSRSSGWWRTSCARHVDELVTVCGPSLRHLPPDVRAAPSPPRAAADAWTTPRSPP